MVLANSSTVPCHHPLLGDLPRDVFADAPVKLDERRVDDGNGACSGCGDKGDYFVKSAPRQGDRFRGADGERFRDFLRLLLLSCHVRSSFGGR
jgi:hypothetical protein